MKRTSVIIFLIFIFVTSVISDSILFSKSNDIVAEIAVAIKSGNATDVSKYFNSTLDITVPGNEGTYSKSQSELILKDFFLKNPVKSFVVKHQGNSNDGSLYAIGNYETEADFFRVYFLLKKVNANYLLHKLEFEKE